MPSIVADRSHDEYRWRPLGATLLDLHLIGQGELMLVRMTVLVSAILAATARES